MRMPCRGELLEIGTPRHRAVLVEDLDDRGGGIEAGEACEITTRLRVARARQHTARLCHDREDVARLAQVLGLASGATAAWIVMARSCAEIPVVMPFAASIEIVKFVA